MQSIVLERGKPYPLPLASTEGASAQFLTNSGSILQIVLPGMSKFEEAALRTGVCKCGLLAQDGAILFLFQFYGERRPILTFDCPFDASIIPADRLFLPPRIGAESRLLFEVHGIDDRHNLRALRALSLPLAVSSRFFAAVQDQLAGIDRLKSQRIFRQWQTQQPFDLVLFTEMDVCGQ